MGYIANTIWSVIIRVRKSFYTFNYYAEEATATKQFFVLNPFREHV